MQVLANQLHFLVNRNAELAVLLLFWPVNCIKIGGHCHLPFYLFLFYAAGNRNGMLLSRVGFSGKEWGMGGGGGGREALALTAANFDARIMVYLGGEKARQTELVQEGDSLLSS